MRVLLAATYHDQATSYTSVMARAAEEYFVKRGIPYVTLYNNDVTRENFERLAKNVDTIVYIGHAVKEKIYGQLPRGYKVPMIDHKNITLLDGKVMLAIACFGGSLGDDAIKAGARAYIGWTTWVYVGGLEPEHSYVADFLRTHLRLVIDIAEGNEPSVAIENFKTLAMKYEEEYEKERYPMWDVYRRFMQSNRLNIRVFH